MTGPDGVTGFRGIGAMEVSIVVPALNAERTLDACLQATFRLRAGGVPYEVIVVDNGSTDGTAETARKYPVRVVAASPRGRGIARNAGLRAANGRYVAFIDSDCVLDDSWLEHALAGFSSANIAGGQLSVVPAGRRAETAPFRNFHLGLPFLDTKGCIVRRDAALAAGGFSEELRRHEDIDFSWRLLREGGSLFALNGAASRPLQVRSAGQLLGAAWDIGATLPALQARWPTLLGPWCFVRSVRQQLAAMIRTVTSADDGSVSQRLLSVGAQTAELLGYLTHSIFRQAAAEGRKHVPDASDTPGEPAVAERGSETKGYRFRASVRGLFLSGGAMVFDTASRRHRLLAGSGKELALLLLGGASTVEVLTDHLAARYTAEPAEVRLDIERILAELRAAGFLEKGA